MSGSRPVIAGAALILASACLNDRTVAPRGSEAALAMRVAAPDVMKQSVSVLVTYSPDNGDVAHQADSVSPYQLFQHTYATTSGYTRVTAGFSLERCLSQFPPDALGPYCDVAVNLQLLEDGAPVQSRTLFPLRIRPGVVTTTDSVVFGGQGG